MSGQSSELPIEDDRFGPGHSVASWLARTGSFVSGRGASNRGVVELIGSPENRLVPCVIPQLQCQTRPAFLVSRPISHGDLERDRICRPPPPSGAVVPMRSVPLLVRERSPPPWPARARRTVYA